MVTTGTLCDEREAAPATAGLGPRAGSGAA
jgi:hypothetical protein